MAQVHPPLSTIRPNSAGEHAEVEILTRLATGLSERYTLFHSVDWTVANGHHDSHGELDIVVVNDAGDIALLEVKAGELTAESTGLTKRYGGESKLVSQQAEWQFGSILHRLKREGLDVRLLHLLVLPHQQVADLGSVAYPRERIADATDCADLPGYIQHRLGSGRPDPELKARVLAFLHNRLPQQPDISALAGQLQRRVSDISGGLATWVPRIHAPSGVIRVRGTAGSGKTQLALTLMREACVRRQATAYVCFNRPLADQMRRHAPDAAQVSSFHQLAWEACDRPPGLPDFAQLASRYAEILQDAEPDLDLLVIDELQDLQPEWVQALLGRVRSAGRVYLLDDPAQCLYPDRAEIEVPEAVLVTSDDNYRSPHRVVDTLNLLRLTDRPIQPCSPLAGEVPDILGYDPATGSLPRQTARAVQRCLERGFALQDIVVLTWRGRESSRLLGLNHLDGQWPLARFTGSYDRHGEPVWSDGPLRIETVRRFKGQSAPAIVLTEVDFDELTPLLRNLLLVALTRAQMHVEWVVSARAQQALERHCA